MPFMLTAGIVKSSTSALMTVSMPSPGRSVKVSCLSAPTFAMVASGAETPEQHSPGMVKLAWRA